MAWLLDTNVVSELRRPIPDSGFLSLLASHSLKDLYLSSVTVAEIRFGIEIAPGPKKRDSLRQWLEAEIRPMFDSHILEISESILFRWRLLVHEGRKAGRTYAQPDLFLAATALEHGLTLATRNTSDFADTGAALFNPWTVRH